jgi:sec-independent protein translocase protein TatC
MKLLPGRFAPRRLDFGEEAPLVDHLSELRHRVVFSLVSLVVAFGVTYAFRHTIITWLEHPLPPQHRQLATFGPAEPFITSLMVSLYTAGLLAMPIIIYQVWAFFAPALSPRIQRAVVGMTIFATFLGALGLAFGYFVALPAAVKFLTSYDSSLYNIQIRAKDYFSFATTVLIAVAVVFELPIVIIGLVLVRVLSYQKLKKNRRLGYVIMAAIAVALPGVDPVTTTLEMIPLMILFEASIWIAFYMERKRRKKAEAEGIAPDDFDGSADDGVGAPQPDPAGDHSAELASLYPVEPEPYPGPASRDPRDRDDL